MRKFLFSILTLTLAIPWPTAHATKGAHGAVSVVCRDRSGAIKSAEILDLWDWNQMTEAHPELQILISSQDEKIFLEKSFQKLRAGNPILAARIEKAYMTVRNVFTRLPGDVKLPELTDTDLVYRPKDCFLEQLASYDVNPISGGEILSVEPEVFSVLDGQSKAGFYLHEAIYKVYRQDFSAFVFNRDGVDFKIGDTSRATRLLVGALLSPIEFEKVKTPSSPQANLCKGKFFDFHIEGEQLHLSRIGMELPTAASGTLQPAGAAPSTWQAALNTKFNPLGGKIKLEISKLSPKHKYQVVSTGSMLNVVSDEVQCTHDIQTSLENL